MKLELKENMYVRNCYGRIAKIEYIEDNTAYCDNWLYQSYEDHITFINLDDEEDIDEILKASYNILDVLEVGDIVTTNNLCGEITKIDKENDRIYTTSYEEEYCSSGDIKKVLTREQFGSIAYGIGGQN